MTEKHPGGRPTQYRLEMCEQALKLCRLGATDKELADFFEVSEQTINTWKQKHPEFLESLKQGKMLADAEVADKLYQRAIGYSHPAEKIFNNNGEELRVPFTEHYPPDTTAALFWLKNRQPEKWRDRQQHELSGPDGGPIVTEDRTPLETARRIAFLLAQAARESQ